MSITDTYAACQEAWQLGGDVDASTTLAPTDGPVWASWHTANYGAFTERFDTASEAVEEAKRRDRDPYYPCWLTEGFTALLYRSDPDEQDTYPAAILEWTPEDDDTPATWTIEEA